ncbi:GNAT family N-acetyltransferase [Metaplanococcus flavidus]|uniref:GNAT family N-acetyltransferase n=1 Tax=Metaplanococcus flavidus TaxID=569883 RepID=A0ABW3LF27_9BACL
MVLTRYKKSQGKIAMGFLSFMPREQDFAVLQKTIQRYETEPDWQLYLCREGNDIIGVIGIEIKKYTFIVHHICVNPSYRNGGVGHLMVEKVQQMHESLAMCTSSETQEFLAKCWDRQHILNEYLV